MVITSSIFDYIQTNSYKVIYAYLQISKVACNLATSITQHRIDTEAKTQKKLYAYIKNGKSNDQYSIFSRTNKNCQENGNKILQMTEIWQTKSLYGKIVNSYKKGKVKKQSDFRSVRV